MKNKTLKIKIKKALKFRFGFFCSRKLVNVIIYFILFAIRLTNLVPEVPTSNLRRDTSYSGGRGFSSFPQCFQLNSGNVPRLDHYSFF